MSDERGQALQPPAERSSERVRLAILAVVLCMAVALAACFAVSALRRANRTEHEHDEAAAISNAAFIESNVRFTWRLIEELARTPEIQRLAAGKIPPDDAAISQTLELTRVFLDASAIRYMDAKGIVKACAHIREEPSTIGTDLSFHPYFTEAIAGHQVIYPAVGWVTKTRGVYITAPVTPVAGQPPQGVVVCKIGMGLIDEELKKHAQPIAMATAEGVVFATNRPGWLFHSLKPLSPETLARIEKRHQFGTHTISPLPFSLEGNDIELDGVSYRAHQVPLATTSLTVISLHNAPLPPLTSLQFALLSVGTSLVLLLGATALLCADNALRRRRSETSLRQARSDLEKLVAERTSALVQVLEHSANGVVVTDTQGRLERVNPAFCRMTGYEPKDVLGQNPRILKSGDQPKTFYEELWRTILSGKEWRGEFHNRRKDGTLYWESASISPVRDADGTISHFLAVKEDITARKDAVEKLRESEDRFKTISHSALDAIIMIDDQGRIVFWNPAAARIFGYAEHEILGQRVHDILVPERLRESAHGGFMRFGSTGQGPAIGQLLELSAIRKDGTEFPIEIAVSGIRKDECWQAIAIIRDIGARKQIEVQLSQAQKLESIGSMAAGIAHEINTPTQYVSDNTSFLKEAFGDLGRLIQAHQRLCEAVKSGEPTVDVAIKEAEEVARKIDVDYLMEEVPKSIRQSQEGLTRVAEIVRAMKEFSHPSSKEKKPVDLNQAIRTTATVARNEWKYVAEMKLDLDPTLPPVPALPGEINQTLLNIIVNAAHAIGDVVKEKPGEKGQIAISTRKLDGCVEIRIADTGGGIPEKVRARVFDPFFTTKGVGKGTGQGLTIAHSVVVNKHGGTLDFETAEGRGTTFVIRLPLNESAQQEAVA